jgi:hypothetical protein
MSWKIIVSHFAGVGQLTHNWRIFLGIGGCESICAHVFEERIVWISSIPITWNWGHQLWWLSSVFVGRCIYGWVHVSFSWHTFALLFLSPFFIAPFSFSLFSLLFFFVTIRWIFNMETSQIGFAPRVGCEGPSEKLSQCPNKDSSDSDFLAWLRTNRDTVLIVCLSILGLCGIYYSWLFVVKCRRMHKDARRSRVELQPGVVLRAPLIPGPIPQPTSNLNAPRV